MTGAEAEPRAQIHFLSSDFQSSLREPRLNKLREKLTAVYTELHLLFWRHNLTWACSCPNHKVCRSGFYWSSVKKLLTIWPVIFYDTEAHPSVFLLLSVHNQTCLVSKYFKDLFFEKWVQFLLLWPSHCLCWGLPIRERLAGERCLKKQIWNTSTWWISISQRAKESVYLLKHWTVPLIKMNLSLKNAGGRGEERVQSRLVCEARLNLNPST